MAQPPVKAATPAQIEAAALRAEAAQTWSSVTGLPAVSWIGVLDPLTEPVTGAVWDALKAGAVVDVRGSWAIVTGTDDKRLVLAADLLRDVLTMTVLMQDDRVDARGEA